MAVCISHGGPQVFRSSSPPGDLLVASVDGVLLLRRAGLSHPWQVNGRWLPGKHVSVIAPMPDADHVWVGTHGDGVRTQGDGLYFSDNWGRSWNRKDRGIDHVDIYSLNFVRSGDKVRLYAGTEPPAMYVSENGGNNWRELSGVRTVPSASRWFFPGYPALPKVKNVSFDPRSPDIIYASIEVGALLRSYDAGHTWQEVPIPPDAQDVHRCVIAPRAPDTMYTTGGDGIYRTRDGGNSWEHLTDRSGRISYPDSLLIHPENNSLLVTGGSSTNPGNWGKDKPAKSAIARSRDAGDTWEVLENGLPEVMHGNIEAMAMCAWDSGLSLFAGTTDGEVFYSDDGGDSWSVIRGLPSISKGEHYLRLQSADMGAVA